MNYSEYPGYKTFVVQHTQGFGDQGGSGIKSLEIRGSFDTREEAMSTGLMWYPRDPSGWTYDSFDILVNSLTYEGKLIQKQREMEGELMQMRINEHPENYSTFKATGYDGTAFSITMALNPIFDNPKPVTPTLENYRMIFIDATTSY